MAFTHVILTQWNANNEIITSNLSLTADAQEYRDIAVPTGSPSPASVDVDLDLVPANVKLFVVSSDKAITLTPYDSSNAAGTPISVAASVPFIWASTSNAPNPISVSSSKFRVTNSTAGAAAVKIRVLYNSTL